MRSQAVRGLVQYIWLGLAGSVLLGVGMFGLGLPQYLRAAVEAAQAVSDADAAMAIGKRAPAFTLSDLSGQTRSLNAAQGRPLILNFWATWCAPCRQEMPLLQRLYDAHRVIGLTVLAISQDTADRAADARTYWEQSGWTFPSLLDPEGAVARQYQVLFLPSTIFINAQGVVTAVHRGPINLIQLQQYLATTMAPRG